MKEKLDKFYFDDTGIWLAILFVGVTFTISASLLNVCNCLFLIGLGLCLLYFLKFLFYKNYIYITKYIFLFITPELKFFCFGLYKIKEIELDLGKLTFTTIKEKKKSVSVKRFEEKQLHLLKMYLLKYKLPVKKFNTINML